jgi:hypothetical protein
MYSLEIAYTTNESNILSTTKYFIPYIRPPWNHRFCVYVSIGNSIIHIICVYLLYNVIRLYTSWKVLRASLHDNKVYKILDKECSSQTQILNKVLLKP